MAPDPSKVAAIKEWPTPRSLSNLRGFLGLTGFYRRFIRNYATLATLLTDLLRQNKFTWNDTALQAFTELKNQLGAQSILHLPDLSMPFQIETDASMCAVGAVLQQAGKPLAFFSKRLCPRMQNASAYTREMFAGKSNTVADALSRQFDESSSILFAISSPVPALAHCKLIKGLWFFKERLIIPPIPQVRQELLTEFHCTPSGGHSGLKATLARIAAVFFWPGMYTETKHFVSHCTVCQQNKASHQKKMGFLQPLPVPRRVWDDLTMDFITHLPLSSGHSTVWVICDRFTKYVHFIGLPAHYTAPDLARRFAVKVFRLHGLPKSIISDRDPVFLSQFWRELFKLQGTTLKFSSAYHPHGSKYCTWLNIGLIRPITRPYG